MKHKTRYIISINSAIHKAENADSMASIGVKIAEVLCQIIHVELKELMKTRPEKSEESIIKVVTQQREKYSKISDGIDKRYSGIMPVSDFDWAFKAMHPYMSEWYDTNILNKNS